VGSWHEQALIDAPIEAVWDLVGDPRRYPEWMGQEVSEVTGLPTVQKGASYEQVTRGPLNSKERTTFVIDELDDLHEIRLRCMKSGWYARWTLTEAEGATFADVEVGMEPSRTAHRAMDTLTGKRWYRRVARSACDGVKRAVSPEGSLSAG
jgi:uncharacterized protein YndB with AHSA1/START domain